MTEVATPARHAAQGQRIRAARIAAGMTEAHVAEALGNSATSSVSKWERGETQPLGWLRSKLAILLGVPYHILFVPEEVADALLLGPRRLLLTAHHLRGSHTDLYVETDGAGRANANWLAKDWLVEDAGNGPRRLRLWHLTLPGEDVLDVLRAEQ